MAPAILLSWLAASCLGAGFLCLIAFFGRLTVDILRGVFGDDR